MCAALLHMCNCDKVCSLVAVVAVVKDWLFDAARCVSSNQSTLDDVEFDYEEEEEYLYLHYPIADGGGDGGIVGASAHVQFC